MAFSNPVSGVITQTGTDTDLSLLGSVTGTSIGIGGLTDYASCEAEGGVFNDVLNTCSVATFPDRVITTFQGTIPHYHPGAGVRLDINGTLTINPEVNVLDSESNRIITVNNGGRLNLGEEITSPFDNTVRKSVGLAITGTRAQPVWYGSSVNNSSIGVESGGTLVCKGATTEFSGMPYFVRGSHVWIDGWIHNCHDYAVNEGTIDPQTGNIVADSVGVNFGANTGAGGRLTKVNRGYIGWTRGGDIRVDDWVVLGGGEFSFGAVGTDTFSLTGDNSLSGTPNGFFGYSAAGAKAPVLVDLSIKGFPLLLENIRLAKSGNFKGIAVQGRDALGQALVTNAYNGTEITIASDLLVVEARNGRIYGRVGRNINVDIKNALDGSTITGGAFFYRDSDNNQRKPDTFNSADDIDDTEDRTFISAITDSNLSADHEVILKIINVVAGAIQGGTSNDVRGINRSFDFTRTGAEQLTYDDTDFGAVEIDDVINVYSTTTEGVTTTHDPITPTAGQTLFNDIPTNETDTIVVRIFKEFNTPFIGDLRTESGVEGEDTMDFVFYHPEYLATTFIDFDLRDNTTGTRTLVANILPDNDYSYTSLSNTTADTVDELYDLIKQRKSDATEALATGIEYPTLLTFAVEKSGNLLDIGSRTFETETGTDRYEITDSEIKVHTTASAFGVGSIFRGILTTNSIDLTNVTLSGGMIMTGGSITNLPTSIGDSTLNPGDDTISGTGGHTVTTDSIINSDLTITGTVKNTFGGTINGTVTLNGGDTDFNGSVDEVGGLTTGNISLGSAILRTIDFKSGSITNGTIIASTATNLVLDGQHDKAVTRSTGTATTTSNGTLEGALLLGAGVLTTGSTFIAKDTVTAGAGNHSIDGDIAKAVVLGNGDSTVAASATIRSGGLDMGTGSQTVNGNVTGVVNSDGDLTTGSTFEASSTVTADDGDSNIDGTIAGIVTLGDATTNHSVSGILSSTLVMGTGTKNQVSGSVSGAVSTTGTIDTTSKFLGGSTVTASTATGDSNVDGTVADKVTLGNATTKHTVGANISSNGLQMGTGTGHVVSGMVTGAVTTTGTLSTTETFQASSTVTANTATGDSTINSNTTGITGNVLLGDASSGHSIPGVLKGLLTMGTGAHNVSGDVTGALSTTGSITTTSEYTGLSTLNAGDGVNTIDGTSAGKVTLGDGAHVVGATISAGGLTMGTGSQNVNGTVTGAITTSGVLTTGVVFDGSSTIDVTGVGDSLIRGTSGNKVTLPNATTKHTVNATISAGGLVMGTGTKHSISGNVTGAVSTTGTIDTTASYQGTGTITANTATGDSNIDSNSTGIAGLVTLGDASTGHTIPGKITSGGLTMGTGAHTIEGDITGAVSTTGTLTTGLVSNFSTTVTASGTGVSTIAGTVGGKLTLGAGNNVVTATITSGGMTLGAGDNNFNGSVTGTVSIGAGDNTYDGTVVGDTTVGDGDLLVDANITGDLTVGDGTVGAGFNFSMDGEMSLGTVTVTFKEGNDVSKIDLVARSGETVTVIGKLESEFQDTDDSDGAGTFIFSPSATTRLTVEISSLPLGSHYVLFDDANSESVSSGEITQTIKDNGSDSDLTFSDESGDGTTTFRSSGLTGKWYLYYVDFNRSASFKGIDILTNPSATVIANLTLSPTGFGVAFEVPVTDITGRTLTVSSTDSTVQPTTENTCETAGGTWDSVAETCSGAVRPEFDLRGCPVRNWADETQSSAIVAVARNSVNYLNAMARIIASDTSLDLPTGETVLTFDAVRPVTTGADWRDGRYFITDDVTTGTQKVSGWYDVDDGDSFSAGTRGIRELTDLASSVDSNGDTQIQSQVRLLISAADIASSTTVELKSETDPINNVLGWIVGTSGTGSKLVGLKPRSEDYNSSTDYKPNT